MLPDCGHLHEEEAEYANRRATRGMTLHSRRTPRTTPDIARALLAGRARREPRDRSRSVVALLTSRSHPRRSAVRLVLGHDRPALAVSGDLGRSSPSILVPPDAPSASDCLLVESTYGNCGHDDLSGGVQIAAVSKRTIGRGGSVLIPAFSISREVLLHQLAGRCPAGDSSQRGCPSTSTAGCACGHSSCIARQSPAATSTVARSSRARWIRSRFPGCSRSVTWRGVQDPQPTQTTVDRDLGGGGNAQRRSCRSPPRFLPDPRDAVALVGFQAQGTRGRQLVDGANEPTMFRPLRPCARRDHEPPVVLRGRGLDELVEWLEKAPSPPDARYVVHGELAAAAALRDAAHTKLDRTVVAQRLGERAGHIGRSLQALFGVRRELGRSALISRQH